MKEKISEEYDKIIEENAKFFKKWILSKEENKMSILKIIMTIIAIFLGMIILLLCPPLLIVMIVILYNRFGQNTRIYQEKLVKPLIEKLDFVDEVNMTEGISSEIYNQANFRESQFDNYSKWHYIKGHLDNAKIEMSKVATTDQYTDSNGNIINRTIFKGFLVVVSFDNVITEEKIYIFNDKDDSRLLNFVESKEKVNMDSTLFEQQFDVYSTNQVNVFEILTADVMEKLREEKENIECKYDLSITNKMIIMRIYDKDEMFEIRNIEKKGKTVYGGDLKKAIVQDVEFVEHIASFMNDLSNNIYNKI